jgi:hypothetical protein
MDNLMREVRVLTCSRCSTKVELSLRPVDERPQHRCGFDIRPFDSDVSIKDTPKRPRIPWEDRPEVRI